jgi:predicted metalloprotease with PDZ domain
MATVAHEFFHAWNVERIRPRSLEPFNFDEANVSGELWLAEGFTQYYGELVMARAGLAGVEQTMVNLASSALNTAISPAYGFRSVVEMSRMAPFVDAAVSVDRTSFDNTFISYYTWGEAIALGLDLSLRERSGGKVTLDHFMRALWQKHGRPGGKMPGYVDNPYSVGDLEAILAEVSGDTGFADDFFARFIQGREVVDYGRLFERFGFVLRPVSPAVPSAGHLRLQDVQGRPRIIAPVPYGSPAYAAGLERDDVIVAVGGTNVGSATDFEQIIRQRKPGDELSIDFERRGRRVSGKLRLAADPQLEIAPAQSLSAEQRRLREAWLSSAARNVF